MSSISEQVAHEFREAARWRGIPAPARPPMVDTTQDVWAMFKAASRRAQGVRVVTAARRV